MRVKIRRVRSPRVRAPKLKSLRLRGVKLKFLKAPLTPEQRLAKKNYTRTELYEQVYDDTSYWDGTQTRPPASKQIVQTVACTRQRQYSLNLTNWRELIRQGVNATTSADNRDVHKLNHGNYRWDIDIHDSSGINIHSVMRGRYVSTIDPASSAVPQSLDDRAKSNFIRKARQAQSSGLSGEFMKDIHKTIGSFARVRDIFLRALGKNVKSVLRLREQILGGSGPKGTKSRLALEAISNNWLEFNYGMSPTISDLQGFGFGLWRAYNRSQSGVDNKHIIGFAKSVELNSRVESIGMNNPNGLPNFVVHGNYAIARTTYVAYIGAVRTLRDNNAAGTQIGAVLAKTGNIINEFGLNLRDFVPTLYECIPYSFVLDYFTNTGQIISAFTYPRSDVLWITRVVRNSSRQLVVYSPHIVIPVSGTVTANFFTQTPVEYVTTYYTRNIYNGSLVPSFHLHLPYRSTDWVSMLALIGSRLLHIK